MLDNNIRLNDFLSVNLVGVFVLPISRREFIKIGAAAAVGVGVASAIEIPILENSNSKASQAQSQVTQGQQGFLTLNGTEQNIVEAVAETMIPTDSNGPGPKKQE